MTKHTSHGYQITYDDGGVRDISASDMDAAIQEAHRIAEEAYATGYDPISSTIWVSARIQRLDSEEEKRADLRIDPREPRCKRRARGHRWLEAGSHGSERDVTWIARCLACGLVRRLKTGRGGYVRFHQQLDLDL